jgi:anti-anti-sigma factor
MTPTPAAGLLIEFEDLRACPASSRPCRPQPPIRCRLRVSGELDLATVGLLRSAIQRAAANRQEVELDLSGVTFCDVVGATALEQAQQQLRARGCQLVLHHADRPLHLLFAVDGLFSSFRPSASLDGHEPRPAT